VQLYMRTDVPSQANSRLVLHKLAKHKGRRKWTVGAIRVSAQLSWYDARDRQERKSERVYKLLRFYCESRSSLKLLGIISIARRTIRCLR